MNNSIIENACLFSFYYKIMCKYINECLSTNRTACFVNCLYFSMSNLYFVYIVQNRPWKRICNALNLDPKLIELQIKLSHIITKIKQIFFQRCSDKINLKTIHKQTIEWFHWLKNHKDQKNFIEGFILWPLSNT